MRGAMVAVAVLACAVYSGCAAAPLTPTEIVAAFIAASQDNARTFHMEWQGTVHSSLDPGGENAMEQDLALTATFAFSGPDFEGIVTLGSAADGSINTTHYARVGGVDFARYGASGWQRVAGDGLSPVAFDPMTGLAAADVTYEGTETLDGRAVHRLRVNDPVAALQRTMFPPGEFAAIEPTVGEASDFLVYVDYQGIPVGAQLAAEIQVSSTDPDSSAPDARYSLASDYTFSGWGTEITILPPEVVDAEIPPPDLPEKPPVPD